MDDKIKEKVNKELYNDLSSIMSEEYENRMLITPSYCANKLLEKGYRKEIDTAREILTLIKNGVELNSMIDGDAKIAIMNELHWAGQRYGIDFTNSLEKGGEKNGKTSS